jgi:ABC-type transporter Mla MlaB component
VAFSFFGKKPSSQSPAAKNSPARDNLRATTPLPVVADELISLDFTRPGEAPQADNPKIEVQDQIHQVPPAVEQAAMLFSADQTQLACSSLEAAIHADDLGAFEQRAWGMLFDLYQQLGQQQAFEILALEYAGKFETSPPAWRTGGGERRTATAATARANASLSGVLNAKISEPLKQLLALAEKSPMVRLDLIKVTDAEEQGCALLRDALNQLKKQKKDFVLGGADRLAAILAKKIVPGRREREPVWLLLLDLYQYLCAQEAFEDTAVNYAVTFEVSPPSWEPIKAKAAAVDVEEDDADNECVLEGDLLGVDINALAVIRGFAEHTDEVVVDVADLRRMDFVSATQLMNLVNDLKATNKSVRLIHASHLLTALWEIIGLDRVARIETRKT